MTSYNILDLAESIAQKKPEELTRYFEQIRGSERYKKEYDQLKVQRQMAEDHCYQN